MAGLDLCRNTPEKSLFNPLWLSSIEEMKHVSVVKELRITKENSGINVRRLSDAVGIYTNVEECFMNSYSIHINECKHLLYRIIKQEYTVCSKSFRTFIIHSVR